MRVISFIISAVYILLVGADFSCWDTSEQANLTFINNANKTLDHLPTIRLIQGYYPSQYAMQYAAYVYLMEKLGVNVTFYPENDPASMPPNPGSNASVDAYPQFYFEEIKQDNYDLLFEIWGVMIESGNGFDYFDDKTVLDVGVSGAFSEAGWFVPKYVYKDNPLWILPNKLNDDESIRQQYIEAYTVNSSTNWIDYWWTQWNDSDALDEYLEYGYEIPNASKPIIWGSYHGYAISQQSLRLTEGLLDGEFDWTFAALGRTSGAGEAALSALIEDLYSKELPFIANLYSPHSDFATTLENDTEYMEFERVALPRNPNNDVSSSCYIDGTCTFPLSPLEKLANPNLVDEFEEMYSFAIDFAMAADDVNDIIYFYNEYSESVGSLNATEHEKWQYAACQWHRRNSTAETTKEWFQNITRYDCLDNCGFNYYYESHDDAVNGINTVSVSWDDSIAGDCLYDSSAPLCECPDVYFVGDSCRQSCPGVIGPILNDSVDGDYLADSRFVSSENYTFYLCSGHGTCDIETKLCECEDGYGGSGCGTEYPVFEYSTVWVATWSTLFILIMIVFALSMYWLYRNQQYKTIRALSPPLVHIFTVGLILFTLSNILYLFHPLTDALCISRFYFAATGATIAIAAPLFKTYRVAISFERARKLKAVKITNHQLMTYIAVAVVVEVGICTAYAVLHQTYGGREKVFSDAQQLVEWKCNQNQTVLNFQLLSYLYVIALLLALCVVAFRNRKSYKVFRESKCAFFGSFFTAFTMLVLFVFNMLVDKTKYIILIQNVAIFILLIVIWSLSYGTRIYTFLKDPDLRDEVTVTAEPSHTSEAHSGTQLTIPDHVSASTNVGSAASTASGTPVPGRSPDVNGGPY